MKIILLLLASFLLSGCESLKALGGAGQTEYSVEPIVTEAGKTICCKVNIYNSKDYEKLKVKIIKKPDGTIEVSLDESGVNSSGPSAVMGENQGKLLDAITSIIPKPGN